MDDSERTETTVVRSTWRQQPKDYHGEGERTARARGIGVSPNFGSEEIYFLGVGAGWLCIAKSSHGPCSADREGKGVGI